MIIYESPATMMLYFLVDFEEKPLTILDQDLYVGHVIAITK